jgi:Zn-dependent protease with chaperone function
MNCPHCTGPTLHQQATKQGTIVQVCSQCHGLWLDQGEIYDFSSQPERLEAHLDQGLRDRRPSARQCPRCHLALEEGNLLDQETRIDTCPQCGGLWFDAREVAQVLRSRDHGLQVELTDPEPVLLQDQETREAAQDRLHQITAGLLALPNLFLRSFLTLALLYGMLGLVLITIVQFGLIGPGTAMLIGVVIAVLQFTLGPWIMDLSLRWLYQFHWAQPQELADHLRAFVDRVTTEKRMRFPHFGIIEDGAPTAFTYGHHPSNARVVISRGILNLLEPGEVEAVVAHELGHARNWDMALMTVANLVPLLLYYLYRVATDLNLGDKKDRGYAVAVQVGAYVLWVISEYIVLWFSRTREYFADRFAGEVTGNPNALASALVKIAYGLAAPHAGEETKEGEGKKERKNAMAEAVGALNIFNRKAAVGMVMAAAQPTGAPAGQLDLEQVKSAMQWDLWNPWAKVYELNSTHPLVAKRLMYLTDQAAHLDQKPLVVFDRRQPKSYWDDFAVDVVIMILPWLCFWGGLAVFVGVGLAGGGWHLAWLFAALGLAGLGSLAKTAFAYRRKFFPHLSVAALLHKVKVSGVRPVPATLTGNIIGRGVPGLVYSEDFVLRDRTGIMFLDYKQPLAIWNFLFGLLRAGEYQGKEVRVSGWFRRAPVPYLEVNRIDVVDGSLPARRCYSYHARIGIAVLGIALGVVGILAMLVR